MKTKFCYLKKEVLLFEKEVLLFEKEVLLFQKGVLLFQKGVLLFQKGVLLYEKGVLAFEKGVLAFPVYMSNGLYQLYRICLSFSKVFYTVEVLNISKYKTDATYRETSLLYRCVSRCDVSLMSLGLCSGNSRINSSPRSFILSTRARQLSTSSRKL